MSTLITAYDAAAKLGFSRRAIHKAVARYGIPHMRIGESIRFDPADLDRFIDLLKTRAKCCPTCGQMRPRPRSRQLAKGGE